MRSRCVSSPYRITQKYGYDPTYPLNGGYHYGTDYVTDDRKILAPQNGTVTLRGYDSVNGNYLVIEGNGYRDWFSHIRDGGYLVNVGQPVTRGQHVANMGTTGASTGVHVHHSLRKDGVRVDPEQHLTQGDQTMNTDEQVQEMYYVLRGNNGTATERKGWIGRPYREFALTARAEVGSREAHRLNLENAVKVLTTERDAARAEVAKLSAEVLGLRDALKVEQAKVNELNAQIEGLSRTMIELEAQKQAQIDELNRVIEIKDNEIKRLTTELANCGGESLSWSQHLVLGMRGLIGEITGIFKR